MSVDNSESSVFRKSFKPIGLDNTLNSVFLIREKHDTNIIVPTHQHTKIIISKSVENTLLRFFLKAIKNRIYFSWKTLYVECTIGSPTLTAQI